MKKEKILVVFGGKSAEHDISIITGLQVLKSINRSKFDVFPLYISKTGEFFFGKKLEDFKQYIKFNPKNFKKAIFIPGKQSIYFNTAGLLLKGFEISCVVLCLHGMNGEDGTIQGLFELCEIPYTSCGVLSSSICMDKAIMKDVLKANKILSPKHIAFHKTEFYLEEEKFLKIVENKFNFSCFVKPANLGSSIGISRCKTKEEFLEAVGIAFAYDEKVVVETPVENAIEVNCAVLGNDDTALASNLEYPKSWSEFLNFDEKYLARKNEKLKDEKTKCLPKKIEKRIQEIAIKAFKAFECYGVVRIDFLVDEITNKIFLNELNSIPGSLAFYLFKENGIDFSKLIEKLILLAKQKTKSKLSNRYSYVSTALANFGQGGKMNKYSK